MADVRIDQALLTHFIAGNFGLSIAHENMDFTPTAGTPYVEVRALQNDVTPATLSHSNETDGVFRAILRYPAGSGAVAAKQKASEIFAAFKIGQVLSYEGAMLTIIRHQRQPGLVADGWYSTIVDMFYKATLAR